MDEFDQYKGIEIPKFLRRSPSETPEDRRRAWEHYQAKRKKEMEIAAAQLDAAIKDTSNEMIKTFSITSLVGLWNSAMDHLERPGDKVKSFRDSETALKRVEGILVTLRTPPKPDSDPTLKPVEETVQGRVSKKAGGSAAETSEQASGTPGKAGKDTGKKMKKAKTKREVHPSSRPAAAGEKPPVHHGNRKLPDLKEAFGTREGSNREKLLEALAASQGKQVSVKDLMKAVYRSTQKQGPLMMVMRGLYDMIAGNKLPFAVHKSKDKEGDLTFGLYSTK